MNAHQISNLIILICIAVVLALLSAGGYLYGGVLIVLSIAAVAVTIDLLRGFEDRP